MIEAREIDTAIAAHGAWKARLKSAIASGTLDIPLEVIRADNQCAFGKWLYSPSLSPAEKASAAYADIKRLHAEFHKCAAQIAELVVAGKKTEALKMLEGVGDYVAVSGKLTMALLDWKRQSAQPVKV